jgi:hypothetical protein
VKIKIQVNDCSDFRISTYSPLLIVLDLIAPAIFLAIRCNEFSDFGADPTLVIHAYESDSGQHTFPLVKVWSDTSSFPSKNWDQD